MHCCYGSADVVIYLWFLIIASRANIQLKKCKILKDFPAINRFIVWTSVVVVATLSLPVHGNSNDYMALS